MLTTARGIPIHFPQPQLTREQAIALVDTHWWVGWDPVKVATFQLHQERLTMPFGVLHETVERVLGRPVWTHEFGLSLLELRWEVLKGGPTPRDQELLDLLPSHALATLVDLGVTR